MKKVLIFLAVIVILGLGFWVFWLNSHPREVVVNGESIIQKREAFDGETVRSGLCDIGKLVTQEYYFTHVENYSSTRSINDFVLPFSENGFVYSYDGVINAGVDFTMAEVKVDDAAKKIEIKLPAPEIMGGEVDPDSRVIYSENNNLLNPIDLETVLMSFDDMLADEEAKALDRGILDKAKDNAQNILMNFLNAVTGDSGYKIKVTFEDEAGAAETEESTAA